MFDHAAEKEKKYEQEIRYKRETWNMVSIK